MQRQAQEVSLDEDDYESEQKTRKNTADVYLADLRKLSECPWGLRIIQHIVDDCNVLGLTISKSPVDSAFLEGKRSVGVGLLRDMKTAGCENLCKIEIV